MNSNLSRRTLPILLLILVLAGIAVWLSWPDSASEPVDPESAAKAPAAAEPLPAPGIGAETPESAPEGLARTDVEIPADFVPAAQALLTVRVVAGAEETPVAGAEVLLWPLGGAGSVPDGERGHYQRTSVDEQIEIWGRTFACDAQGVAHVPIDELNWFPVAARHGILWAREDLTRSKLTPDTVITLTLQPALHLEVLVVDERRQPVADVPVAYWPMNQGRISGNDPILTDANGRAHLRHQEYEFRRHESWADQHAVGIALPFDPQVLQIFDPLAPPTEPILLVLPAAGTVEVEVYTADGIHAPDGTGVDLQQLLEDADPHSRPGKMNLQSKRGRQFGRVKDGVARFDGIGLGLVFESGVDFARTRVYDRAVGSGPTRPGEVVRLVIKQTATFPELTGRVVNEFGEPVARVSLDGNLTLPDAERGVGIGIGSDEAGRFRLALGMEDARGEHLWVLFRSDPGSLELAVVTLTLPLAPGLHDLGDVVLGGPLLASGTVFDEEGNPTPNAYGTIGAERLPNGNARFDDGPFSNPQWRPAADGSFRIHGPFPHRIYRLTALRGGNSELGCKPIDTYPGATDLEFRFGARPGISGRVILDGGLPVDALSVLLENASGGYGTSPSAPHGRFHLPPMGKAMSGDLVIRLDSNGPELWRRPGVSLAFDTVLEVGDVDLRGRLTTTQVSVQDPEGGTISKARLFREGERPSSMSQSWPDLPGQILSVGATSGWLDVDGYALAPVVLNGSPQVVQLSRGIPVRLSCPNLPTGQRWMIWLDGDGASGVPGLRLSRTVNLPAGSDSADLIMPATGTWKAHLSWQTDQGSGRGIPDAFGETASFVVHSGSSLQEVSLPVDLAAIRVITGEN